MIENEGIPFPFVNADFSKKRSNEDLLTSVQDLNKDGEFKRLEFPAFHKELLSQSYWNPGDELGRIKLVISEGFSVEKKDPIMSDRVQNIVAFSFQHAPLGMSQSLNLPGQLELEELP